MASTGRPFLWEKKYKQKKASWVRSRRSFLSVAWPETPRVSADRPREALQLQEGRRRLSTRKTSTTTTTSRSTRSRSKSSRSR